MKRYIAAVVLCVFALLPVAASTVEVVLPNSINSESFIYKHTHVKIDNVNGIITITILSDKTDEVVALFYGDKWQVREQNDKY